jgi:hypothetical protein
MVAIVTPRVLTRMPFHSGVFRKQATDKFQFASNRLCFRCTSQRLDFRIFQEKHHDAMYWRECTGGGQAGTVLTGLDLSCF